MQDASQGRGSIQRRMVWICCGVFVLLIGGHHYLLRSHIDKHFGRFEAKCCPPALPAPVPDPNKDFAPPYFAGFRLHNSATHPVVEVQIEVKKDLPDGGLWSAISSSVFEPPPPPLSAPIPSMGIWMPLGNNDPEPIWGVRVLVKMQGEDDYRVALVEGLNGKADVQVDIEIDETTWIDADGNPVTDIVVSMKAWFDFADGTPQVASGDSRP